MLYTSRSSIKHLFEWRNFLILTDHKTDWFVFNKRFFFSLTKTNRIYFSLSFHVQLISGRENILADLLSRCTITIVFEYFFSIPKVLDNPPSQHEIFDFSEKHFIQDAHYPRWNPLLCQAHFNQFWASTTKKSLQRYPPFTISWYQSYILIHKDIRYLAFHDPRRQIMGLPKV